MISPEMTRAEPGEYEILSALRQAGGRAGWLCRPLRLSFHLLSGGDRTLVIGALTEHAGMSAAEAADVLRRLPTRVLRAAHTLQAEKLEKALRRAGAQAETRTAAP
jgi:hypothetical protein